MNERLREAIVALKQGDREKAYRLAGRVIKSEPDNETLEVAWLVLGTAVTDLDRKKRSYEAALMLNPENEVTRRELAKLEAAEADAQTGTAAVEEE